VRWGQFRPRPKVILKPGDAGEVTTVSTFRVLFVDDEVDFLETLIKRMQKRHVEAFGVKSGEEAVVWLRDNPADVVVLDVRMQGMDGIQTLRAIKSEHPLLEVIMLTGHASLEIAKEGMQLGAFDYLMKPVDLDELLYKLEDAYKKKTIQQQKIKTIEEVIESRD
jgi:DNA-binding NtrC family response regulator